jgi:hypothetical protein
VSYAVVVPTYHEHFWCVLRLAKSFRDKVTDAEQFKFLVVTTNERETDVLRSQLNAYVPGSTAVVVSYEHVLKQLRLNATNEIFHNVYKRDFFRHSYQSLKKLCSAVYAEADQVLLVDSESRVYRDMSVWDDIIAPYLERPQHFSYVSQQPFLHNLRIGASHLLHYNHDTLLAYNFEYQNWVLERDLLCRFLDYIRDSWSCNTFFDAIHKAFFSSMSANSTFFEMMAYRYWIEQQQLHGTDERFNKYEFLDSFDAFSQCMSDAVLAAAKPSDHPVEHLGAWITPATFDGIQNFFRTFRMCMMRLETHYPNPWLVRQFIKETPELKMFVCSPDYEIFV